MSTSDPAPSAAGEHDPAAAHDITIDAPEQEKKDHKPRDSKGWDGKLRLTKKGADGTEEGDDAPSNGEESEEEGPPPEQLAADEDLLDDVPDDEDEIDLVHCRISSIPALKLDRFTKLKRLCLRQNQIMEIDLPDAIAETLEDLDFYDNLIAHIRGLEPFTELTSLDLSFNKIKHIKRINHLTKLRDLYFVQNKISTIEGLDGLPHLRNLELGANRIREIDNLETLTALEELWLGKNKITEIRGLDTLTNLKILSIQSNRLEAITGLDKLVNLEELHISHNKLTEISGLDNNTNLRVMDVSNNPIEHLQGLSHLTQLEELWASNTKFSSFDEVEKELRDKQNLQTVYFEGSPLQRNQPVLYRNKVRLAIPHIKQIDATYVTAR